MIELARTWLRYQPDSALSRWFQARVGNLKGRPRRIVEQKYIDAAMERNSSHCATADAINEQVPEARHISVDLQTIRWTDSRKGVRYVFLTPYAIQTDIIIPFDQGRSRELQAGDRADETGLRLQVREETNAHPDQ
jgi:hypothetical protein